MPEDKKKILIILIAGLGDLILASQAIRAIRNRFVNEELHLLTTTQGARVAGNYNYIDRVWSFPIRELRNKKLANFFDIITLIRRLRKYKFEIAINLYRVHSWSGALKMGLLLSLLKTGLKAGHGEKGFGFFLDRKTSKPIFQIQHTADAMLELSRLIGSIPDERGIEVFWNKNVEPRWQSLLEDHSHSKKCMIGLNPGADNPNKRWPLQHYAAVADRLVGALKAEVILLGGPGEEMIANAIEAQMLCKAINLAGQLTLDDLVYLVSRLDLLLTNDSGPMHIAAAVHTPLVALFGPETPALFGPYAKKELYRVVYKELDCRPCGKRRCEHPLCLDLVTPQEVYENCLELLNK